MVGVYRDALNVYIALEFIPHSTLSELIGILRSPHDRRIDASTARFLCGNIVCGLAFLHKYNIVHCDLKPGNILVGRDGYLVLADFGMAKDATLGVQWAGLGTPIYMAPEIVEHWQPDPACVNSAMVIDWWALGCIMFETCNGKPVRRSPTHSQSFF